MTDKVALIKVETLVDSIGLRVLVELLAQVAHEKAEHVASNWQDAGLAKAWERDAGILEKAAAKISVS